MNDSFDEVLLTAYLDNELTTEERKVVEEQLERSESSRLLLEELKSIRNMVSQLQFSPPTRDFTRGPWSEVPIAPTIESNVDSPSGDLTNPVVALPRPSFLAQHWRTLASLAAVAMVAICASVLWRATDAYHRELAHYSTQSFETPAESPSPTTAPVVNGPLVPREADAETPSKEHMWGVQTESLTRSVPSEVKARDEKSSDNKEEAGSDTITSTPSLSKRDSALSSNDKHEQGTKDTEGSTKAKSSGDLNSSFFSESADAPVGREMVLREKISEAVPMPAAPVDPEQVLAQDFLIPDGDGLARSRNGKDEGFPRAQESFRYWFDHLTDTTPASHFVLVQPENVGGVGGGLGGFGGGGNAVEFDVPPLNDNSIEQKLSEKGLSDVPVLEDGSKVAGMPKPTESQRLLFRFVKPQSPQLNSDAPTLGKTVEPKQDDLLASASQLDLFYLSLANGVGKRELAVGVEENKLLGVIEIEVNESDWEPASQRLQQLGVPVPAELPPQPLLVFDASPVVAEEQEKRTDKKDIDKNLPEQRRDDDADQRPGRDKKSQTDTRSEEFLRTENQQPSLEAGQTQSEARFLSTPRFRLHDSVIPLSQQVPPSFGGPGESSLKSVANPKRIQIRILAK